MKNTTLCYIEKDNQYLMLHRTKKEVDENKGKWIGVGGKFEEGESPEDCLLREVYEETDLTLKAYELRGIVTFVSDAWESQQMFLFTASAYEGELKPCEEGDLSFVPKDKIMDLELWEGDRLFLPKLFQKTGFFTMKLCYQGDDLVESQIHEYA